MSAVALGGAVGDLSGGEAMVEPLILSDEILTQARLWRDECLNRWGEEGAYPQIGEANLTSTVDGSQRKVVLHLGTGFTVKGKTFAKTLSETGEPIGEGSIIVLNRGVINHQVESIMPILLHELTHAVDPAFDDDNARRETEPERFTTSESQYSLLSEQRAFAAMWTNDLREDIKAGRYRNAGVAINVLSATVC